MTPLMFRELFAFDRWANRGLLEAVSGLGPGMATRPIGAQFSFPTLKGMLIHILDVELRWLARWRGEAGVGPVLGDADVPDMRALGARWEVGERDVQAFVDGLGAADLDRLVRYTNLEGEAFALPLWVLLQHVADHSTHHRSEVATMLTMVAGPPPPTGLVRYHLIASGQMKAS